MHPPCSRPDGNRTGVSPTRATASRLLSAAYPHPGPSVWKDPRACLLLPYWREVLHAPMAAVLVWRGPLAVARSLQRRDGLPVPYGVALWERYNRSAIANLARTDVYVLDYDGMIEEPATSLAGLSAWLHSIGTFEAQQPWGHERALAVVTANLRHESAGTSVDDGVMLEEQRRLVQHLTNVAGGHRSLPQLTGDESPWTTAILDPRRALSVLELRKVQRQLEHSNAERDWFASALEEERTNLARLKASSSWRMTAPVRSVAARLAASRHRRGRALASPASRKAFNQRAREVRRVVARSSSRDLQARYLATLRKRQRVRRSCRVRRKRGSADPELWLSPNPGLRYW